MLGRVVELDIVEMARPNDDSGLRELLTRRRAEDVVAIIGKTEGTGLGKDAAREAADRVIKQAFADNLGISSAEVAERICMVLSGGSPGVITPHVAVLSSWRADEVGTVDPGGRLVAGVAHSDPIEPHEVGRTGQIRKVASAVRAAVRDAAITDTSMVHAVLVKAPALTERGIADEALVGRDTVTRDLGIGPEGAMCFSNDASALGVAVALNEVPAERISDSIVRTDFSLYSEVALTSSGGEKTRAEVLVLGNSPAGVGPLRIGHSPMRDVLDVEAVARALASARGAGSCEQAEGADRSGATVAYMLGKMIVPGSRLLRGHHISWQDDPMGYHVAKAMGGYLLATTTGTTCSFASGGEQNSHQGPPDGNPLAAIVRIEGQF
jgi:cyanuric acid amidohydrolase